MKPLVFEQKYQNEWHELDGLLAALSASRSWRRRRPVTAAGARLATLYRRACEQLATARARAYPAYMISRLEQLTQDAHQAIYRTDDFGLRRFATLMFADFPRAVRAHARSVWLAAACLYLPAIIMGLLVFRNPEWILSVVNVEQVAEFEAMYSTAADSIGRTRDADTDWMMFGYYVWHNTSLAFQCYAGGIFVGLLSVFALAYNGIFIGAIAGYLSQRGLGSTFWSFVATHSAFELTAIVLAGGAGMRLGYSLLAPGRRSRLQSLVHAARASVDVIYGVAFMLLIAAAIEAFWSSAPWLPHAVKYSVAAGCWVAVLTWLWRGGREHAS